MGTRAILAGCAVAVLVFGPGGASGATDPATMTLQRGDLPSGFVQTAARSRSNAAVVKETGVALATLRGWGRTGGFERTFDLPIEGETPPPGPVGVTSAVSLYRSTAGARKGLTASFARIEADRKPRPERLELPGRLGDGGRLWLVRVEQDGLRVVVYRVVWRSGTRLASLAVAGIDGKLTVAQVFALAKRQQQHMDTPGPGPEPVA